MELLDIIKRTKNDYSNYLIHFTKQGNVPTGITREEYDSFAEEIVTIPEYRTNSAIEVLTKILTDSRLVAKSTHGSNGVPVVSFSESPLQEILSLMKLPEWPNSRYQPYGVLFKKEHLFALGARPVIYQDKALKAYLNQVEELKHRHVTLDYPHVDFSWEREWVIKGDLNFDFKDVVILVKSFEDVQGIKNSFPHLQNIMPLSVLLNRF